MTKDELTTLIHEIKNSGVSSLFKIPTAEFDQKAIEIYNSRLEQGADHQVAYTAATKDTNEATRNLINTANGVVISEEKVEAAAKQSTLAFKAQAAASSLAASALNAIVGYAITRGLQLLGESIYRLLHQFEIAEEKATESREAYEELTSEIKNLNDELSTTAERISELESKDSLSFVEQDELNKLQKASDLLERQIELKEIDQKIAAKQAREDAVDALNVKSTYVSRQGWTDLDSTDVQYQLEGMNLSTAHRGTVAENAIKQLEDYERYVEHREALNKRLEDLKLDYGEDYISVPEYGSILASIDTYDTWIRNLEDIMSDSAMSITQMRSSLDPTEDAYLISSIDSFLTEYTNKFKDAGDESEAAFNKIWGSYNFAQQRKELEDLAKAGQLDGAALGVEKYNSLLEATGRNADSLANHINAVVNGIGSVVDKEGNWSLSETGSQAIDNFQSQIASLGEALTSLRSGNMTDSALLDLQQEFPVLQGQSANLEQAIIDLIYNALEKLYGILGESCPDEFKNSLQKITDEASNVAPNLNTALTSVQNSYKILDEFKDAMSSGGLTDSILTSVAGLSGPLEDMVAQFYAGAVSADQLFTALNTHYENDVRNYAAALLAKHGHEETFTNSIGLNSAELTNHFKDDYGVDLTNHKTYASKKLEIEKQLLESVSSMWSTYYNAQTGTFTASMEALDKYAEHARSQGVADQDNQYLQLLNGLNAGVEKYEAAIKELDTITYNGITSSFEGISSGIDKQTGSGSSSSSSKDTKQEFNWIEHRNELLQRQHDILSKTAEDETKSYNERIFALNELITMDKERIAFAQEAKDKYESIYNEALQNPLLEKEFGAISEVIGSYGEQQEEANVQALQLIEAQKEFEEASAGLATEAIEAITSQQPVDPNRNSAFDLLGTSEEKVQEATDTMASAETEAIAKAKDAYEEYVALKENSILSESDLQALVENGGMFVGEYDQETSDAINKVVDAYKQMLEYSDQLEETEEEQLNHKREALKLQEEIIKAQQEQLNAEISRIDAELDYLESSGGVVTEGYYKEQIRLSKELTEAYEDQINNLYEQRDLVDDGSAEYYSLSAQIEDCEQQIIECKTQQEEWNEAIKRLPVDRMQKYINMLKAIKQELDDFLTYQETIGQATTKDQFQQLLEINEEQVKTLQKQSTELLGLLDDYDYGSEKFNEVAEELSSIQNETANLVNEMQEYNNEILQIPINKLEEVNENLEKYSAILQSILDDYDQTLSAVTGVLDAQVSELEKLKEQTEDTYKAQIDPLQEQLDLLNKVNEARQMQMQLEQALYNLQKAQNQKTTMIINSKGEKEYVTDINAVRDAQKEYQDTLYDKQVYDLETQIKSLEEERDALLEGYDDEIDRLNKISEKWSEIKNEIQLSADILKANQIFGTEEWQEKVVSGNDQDLYDMFKEWYSSTSEQKTQVDEQIASNERIVETMQEFVDRFIDGSISYESALQNVSDLYSKLDSGYSALEELSTFMNMDNLKSLVDIQTSAQEQISENVELLNGYLTIANQNQTLIDNYTSTWEEMSTMIDEQLEALKKAAEALEEWVKNQKYHKGSSYDSDSDGGGNWSGGVESTGIIESGMNGGNYSESHWDAGQSPYSDDDDDIYHRGIEKGEIGKADRTRTEFLRQIATQDMEPDERYIRAQVGEVVLNDEQQAQLAKNFETLSLANLVPVFSMPELGVGLNTTANDINIQFGDLNLPDVRDVDGFARALTAQFPNIMRQELSKWN